MIYFLLDDFYDWKILHIDENISIEHCSNKKNLQKGRQNSNDINGFFSKFKV